MKTLLPALIVTMALAATATSAQPVRAIAATSEQAIPEEALRGDPERRICKKIVATGSRLKGGRVCKKAREWVAGTEEDRKALERIQTQRSVATPG